MLKVVAALGLALIALAAAAPAAPTAAAHSTAVVFNAKSMRVTARKTGYCWTSSIASQRSDAYRCMVSNSIHDPCFALSARAVACPAYAAPDSGVVISLTKPLPENNAAANAWMMLLASGATCNIGTGTTIADYPFYCTGNIVCSAPPNGKPHHAVFVRCAPVVNGKTGKPGRYLVSKLYE